MRQAVTAMHDHPDTVRIVVLNDGETFTDVAGCRILTVPYAQYVAVVEAGGDAGDFEPVAVEVIE
jgi:hypothetical protein